MSKLLLEPVVHSKIVESQVKGSFTCPTITVPFTLNDKIKVPQTQSKHRRLVRLFLTPLTPGLSKPQTATDIQTNMLNDLAQVFVVFFSQSFEIILMTSIITFTQVLYQSSKIKRPCPLRVYLHQTKATSLPHGPTENKI